MLEKINECPICKETSFEKHLKVKDRFNTLSDNSYFTLVKCDCKFVFLNPRPNIDNISKFYPNEGYNPHSDNESTIIDSLYKIVQKFAFRWKRKVIQTNIKTGNLLDIGGGRGEFCEYMEENGFKTTLYDTSLHAIHQSNCTSKTIELQSINKQFNVITLWHSLEHVHDLANLFNHIKRLLTPGGILLIAVPNIEAFDQDIFKEKWIAYDAPRHLHHFSNDSLSKLLNKNDIKITKSYKIIQDTPYNILLSSSGNIILVGFKTLILTIITLIISFMNSKKSSSILNVCEIK